MRDDWEIFIASRDGSGEVAAHARLQHDVLPQFVSGDRVLEVIGEPRHRRSFLLDVKTGTQTRLFHNNTRADDRARVPVGGLQGRDAGC